jgi:hypothetical protein
MFRKRLQPKNILTRITAALLAITLSGAYYFFCCQEMDAAPAKAESCPLIKVSKSEHCNFSKHQSPEASQTATSVNTFECCGLKFNFFVAKLEKNDFPQQVPAAQNNFFNFLQSVKSESKQSFTDFSYHAPIFDSRDLRVKNCVFRI